MSWNNFPENWEGDAEVVEVLECDKVPIELTIGTLYHCIWTTSKGMVWVLKGISNNNQAILETPRTKKIIYTHVHNLRHINKNALWQAKQRIKKEKNEKIRKIS